MMASAEFPRIELAAKEGQEHIQKRVRKQRLRSGLWLLYAGGVIPYNGYKLVQNILAGKGWDITLYSMVIIVCLGIVYNEVRSYRRFRNRFQGHQKFFDLCPAAIQRIMIIRNESRRKNLLRKMKLEAEKRRDKVAP